ncbi:hypothetical protein [Mycobacterium sp. BK086]|uniref:hypothetical protein n=1 Tax=Mycobacterium sp. BK086 TaxID=2512165 RepID=UPI00256FC90C|nr:hypothetical protein [Mycobacterium sp. BK086]
MPFHSPPNWPKPPPGWVPGPDWTPDPSWPPPPPGWVFWTTSAPPSAIPPSTLRPAAITPPKAPATPRSVDKPRSIGFPSASTPSTPVAPPRKPGITAPAQLSTAPVRNLIARLAALWRRGTEVLIVYVNPIRLGYALTAAVGVALFGWFFALLRLSPNWIFEGWLWGGVMPVVAMFVGVAVGIVGAVGVRRWDHARWLRWRAAP